MNAISHIGREIKNRRRLLRLTQDDLAEICGISIRSLKAIELGKGNPSFSQLSKVLGAIGLKITVGKK
jgi:transcriptional regulator with XRE-family HTH domain